MADVETASSPSAPARRAASTDRRCLSTQRRTTGRYDYSVHGPRADTWRPAGGVARPPHPTRRRETALGAVVDPSEDGRKRIEVAINRKVDLLEDERAHRLISEAAYLTGRHVQSVFERSSRIGSSNWAGASRIDPTTARDDKAVRIVETAQANAALEKRIRDRLGMIDSRLLRRILGDGLSFAQCASLQGKSGDRGERYVKARFREALEDLAEAFAAKGAARPAPDDSHQAAAGAAPARQVAAIAGGATRRRLTGELRGAREAAMHATTQRERREAGEAAEAIGRRLAWLGGEEG